MSRKDRSASVTPSSNPGMGLGLPSEMYKRVATRSSGLYDHILPDRVQPTAASTPSVAKVAQQATAELWKTISTNPEGAQRFAASMMPTTPTAWVASAVPLVKFEVAPPVHVDIETEHGMPATPSDRASIVENLWAPQIVRDVVPPVALTTTRFGVETVGIAAAIGLANNFFERLATAAQVGGATKASPMAEYLKNNGGVRGFTLGAIASQAFRTAAKQTAASVAFGVRKSVEQGTGKQVALKGQEKMRGTREEGAIEAESHTMRLISFFAATTAAAGLETAATHPAYMQKHMATISGEPARFAVDFSGPLGRYALSFASGNTATRATAQAELAAFKKIMLAGFGHNAFRNATTLGFTGGAVAVADTVKENLPDAAQPYSNIIVSAASGLATAVMSHPITASLKFGMKMTIAQEGSTAATMNFPSIKARVTGAYRELGRQLFINPKALAPTAAGQMVCALTLLTMVDFFKNQVFADRYPSERSSSVVVEEVQEKPSPAKNAASLFGGKKPTAPRPVTEPTASPVVTAPRPGHSSEGE